MVRAPTTGPSRAASSAGGSVARDIIRKREKTYKTEYQKVMAKKRRLNINTSYRAAPEGYTFLPVGTPDLADLCKKLSKQRDLPVNVVNAKPASKIAADPSKLSHHVHRIGYHFHSEVVEEAVSALNYTVHKGHFIKEEDLIKKQQESSLAKIMNRWGIKSQDPSVQESPDQVRGAIKELFPKIPNEDLEEIVKHAWAEGTGRVGSVQTLDLSRRVQLAVIARIRHTYTDYDRLLRAFEWSEARKMTEPVCLQKLIEWRGESDIEDDDGLEEIVRETIVIDDDDDDEEDDSESNTMANGSEADDEDSAAEQGDQSDASIEITRHLADDTDIGGESTYEGRHPLVRRAQYAERRSHRQAMRARQKIAHARAAGGQAISYAHPGHLPDCVLTANSNIETVHVPHGPHGSTPSSFERGGVLYRPIPPPLFGAQPMPPWAQKPPPFETPHLNASAPSPYGEDVVYRPSDRQRVSAQDRPVASIERDDGYKASSLGREQHQVPYPAPMHARPFTPESGYSPKRRRIDHGPEYPHPGTYPASHDFVDLTTPEQPRHRMMPSYNGEVVDLSTPEPPYQPVHPSPLREVRNAAPVYGQFEPQRRNEQVPPPHQPSPMRISPPPPLYSSPSYQDEADSLAYDPRQPILQLPQQVDRLSIRPEQSMRSGHGDTSIGYPIPAAQWPAQQSQPPQPPPQQYYLLPPPHPAHHPIISPPPPPPQLHPYHLAPHLIVYEQPPPRMTPQPIHGAPAPVQTLPRHAGYARPPTVPPPVPPTDGAPHPAQMYHPR